MNYLDQSGVRENRKGIIRINQRPEYRRIGNDLHRPINLVATIKQLFIEVSVVKYKFK